MAMQLNPVTGAYEWVDDISNSFGFGFGNTGMNNNLVPTATTSVTDPMGFSGYSTNAITPVNGTQPTNDLSQFITGVNNVDGTQTLSTADPITGHSTLASAGSTNTVGEGFFGDFTNKDIVNLGGNLAQLGAGIYYQSQVLDQRDRQLDLNQQKFDAYQAQQKKLDDAYAQYSASAG